MFLGTALRRVLLREFSRTKQASRILFKISFQLLVLIIMLLVLTHLFAEDLFNYFFGNKWDVANEIILLMLIWSGTTLVSSPSRVFHIARKENDQLLVWDVINAFIRIIVLYLSINATFYEL